MATKPARQASAPRDVRARLGLDRSLLLGRFRRVLSALTLAVIDVTGATLALYAALVVRELYRSGSTPLWAVLWNANAEWTQFIALVVVLVFAKNGLYRPRESRPGGGTVIASLALATLLLAMLALGTGQQFHSYYSIFWVTFLFASALITAMRASYDSITLTMMRLLGIHRRTLLAGPRAELEGLRAALRRDGRGPDMRVIGAVTLDGRTGTVAGMEGLGAIGDLPQLVSELEPDDLVVTGVHLPDEWLLELVETCREHRTRLRLVPTTAELLLDRAVFVPGQAVPLLEVRPPVLEGVDWVVKRVFDVLVAVVLLALLSPLLVAVALAVKLTSRGSVIYRDRRVGVGEREFDLIKFRSMYADAATRQAELERLNEADGAIFKIRNDPRVTPVGRVLRRLSIDELPQLVNVLRGEMSLVGPRPLPVRDYALLEPWHRRRYRVLPGITGLWQVSGRSSLSFDDLVRLDFYYLENWSLWLDIAILLRTPFAVMRGSGAY